MVQLLNLQVNLAQQAEVGRMQQAGIQQTIALNEHVVSKLETQTENAQTSVQTTQPSSEQRTEERKNNKNPFWWKRQRTEKEIINIYSEEEQEISYYSTKGRVIDVWR